MTKHSDNAETETCDNNVLCDVSIEQKIRLKWSKCKTQMRLFVDDIEYATFKNHNDGIGWRDLYLPNKKSPQGFLVIKFIGYKSIEHFLSVFNNDFEGIIKNILFEGKYNNIT